MDADELEKLLSAGLIRSVVKLDRARAKHIHVCLIRVALQLADIELCRAAPHKLFLMVKNWCSFQGLPTGNFSFQVKAIDAAGNAGKATSNYAFSVDSRIKDSSTPATAYWGLGWKFWLIIGAGSFLVLAVIAALSASTAVWLKRRRPTSYQPQENSVVSLQIREGLY